MELTIHQSLAYIFLRKDYNAKQQRAYALWCYMRSVSTLTGKKLFPIKRLVGNLATQLKKHPGTVMAWFKAGVELGLFENATYFDGTPMIYLVGLEQVCYKYLDGFPPGKAIRVDVQRLMTPSLQELRAVLTHTRLCGHKNRICSRPTEAKLSGWTEQTHRNYSYLLKHAGMVFVAANYYEAQLPATKQDYPIKQAPNTYINRGVYRIRDDNPATGWDDNSRRGYIPTRKNLSTKNQRRYFHDQATAEAVYGIRSRRADRQPHFNVVDTYYPNVLYLEDRQYRTLKRIRPYHPSEIPENVRMDDEMRCDEQTRLWTLKYDSVDDGMDVPFGIPLSNVVDGILLSGIPLYDDVM